MKILDRETLATRCERVLALQTQLKQAQRKYRQAIKALEQETGGKVIVGAQHMMIREQGISQSYPEPREE